MFIGHYAVGFAAKAAAPKPSLGTYIMAVSFLDLLWPVFLLLGIEHVQIHPGDMPFTPLAFIDYPWSHSLLMTVIWSTLVASIYYALRRDRTGAITLWLAVASHWVLDAIVHRPDFPLVPGGLRMVGFGLWNSVIGTITVESIMFIIGVSLYVKSTKASDKIGSIGFWALIVFTVAMYVLAAQGTPPPNEQVLAWGGLGAWIFVIWSWWTDKHRTVKLTSSPSL